MTAYFTNKRWQIFVLIANEIYQTEIYVMESTSPSTSIVLIIRRNCKFTDLLIAWQIVSILEESVASIFRMEGHDNFMF
jgi:hypothetical protein